MDSFEEMIQMSEDEFLKHMEYLVDMDQMENPSTIPNENNINHVDTYNDIVPDGSFQSLLFQGVPFEKENEKNDTTIRSEKESDLEPTFDFTKTIVHNKVNVSSPDVLERIFSSSTSSASSSLTEEDLKHVRNVEFDMSQSGHAPARQACHTMKLLRIISKIHDIPLNTLLWECGSLESHRCQGTVTKKGETMQCGSTCVVGEFFCAHHKKWNTQDDGMDSFINKRARLI